jgi:hypothetical protein
MAPCASAMLPIADPPPVNVRMTEGSARKRPPSPIEAKAAQGNGLDTRRRKRRTREGRQTL